MRELLFLSLFLLSNKEDVPFPWWNLFFELEYWQEAMLTERYLCESGSTRTTCACDEAFFRRADCCVDQFWKDFQPKNLNLYLEAFLEKGRLSEDSIEPEYRLILTPQYLRGLGLSTSVVTRQLITSKCDPSSMRYFTLGAMLCLESNFRNETDFLLVTEGPLYLWQSALRRL